MVLRITSVLLSPSFLLLSHSYRFYTIWRARRPQKGVGDRPQP